MAARKWWVRSEDPVVLASMVTDRMPARVTADEPPPQLSDADYNRWLDLQEGR